MPRFMLSDPVHTPLVSLSWLSGGGPVVLEIISPGPDLDFRDDIDKLGAMGW